MVVGGDCGRIGSQGKRMRRAVAAALMMTSSLATVGLTAPAHAQEATRDFDIPAQPLATALTAFGQQSGLQVSAQAPLVEGKTSSTVRGTLSAMQALSQLLAGTGLTFRMVGSTVTLEPAPVSADDAIQLGAVRVGGADGRGSGSSALLQDPGITEGTGSYTTRSISTATRLDLAPRETPQTVNIVTRQQIEDFELTNVDEILRSTSGVFVYNRGPNGSEYYSRGFTMQSQYDGQSNPLGISNGNIMSSPDSVILDRVEVLQGASGLLTGAGEPGGVINMVRKRPTADFQAYLSARGGSWNFHRFEGDISGRLTESGGLRGRIVAAYQDNDTSVDLEHNNNRVLYAVAEADITPSTTIMGSAQYQNWQYNKHWGVPKAPDGSDLGFSRSDFFGISGEKNNKKENLLFTAKLSHRFDNDWDIEATYQRAEGDVRFKQNYFIGSVDESTGNGLTSLAVGLEWETSSQTFDVHAKGPLTLFGRKHELFFGASGSEVDQIYRNALNRVDVNVYDYDPSIVVAPTELSDWQDGGYPRQYGAYAGGRFRLTDSLSIILGNRISWYRDDSTRENGVYLPYGGILYDISKQLTLYASYSDIFSPQMNKGSDGRRLSPVVGRNYEAGVKAELLDGLLNGSFAVFRLEQTNLPEIDESIPFDINNICEGSCYIPVGKVVSEGVDFSLNGSPARALNLTLSYTFTRSEVAEGESAGERFNTIHPKHRVRLNALYTPPESPLSFGAEALFQSEIYEAGFYREVDYRTEQKPYFLLNLTAQYRIDRHARIGLSVDNLLDKTYFESVGSTRLYNIYGSPRSAFLSLRYDF